MNPLQRERRHATDRGVTLTELLMAILIMTPVIVLVLGVFMKNLRGVTESWEETKATTAAQRLMDKIRPMRWDETTGLDGTVPSLAAASILTEEPASPPSGFDDIDDWNGFDDPDPLPTFASFERRVTVTFVNVDFVTGNIAVSGTPTNFKQVTVEVTYLAGKKVVLSSVFPNSRV